jgi:hypothetical protein
MDYGSCRTFNSIGSLENMPVQTFELLQKFVQNGNSGGFSEFHHKLPFCLKVVI